MPENKSTRDLWPFGMRAALVCIPVGLVVQFTIVAVARVLTGWPDSASGRIVLIGIFALSVIPVMLALADVLIQHGASVEFKGVKLNLESLPRATAPTTPIPTNIGVTSRPVGDSGSSEILGALEKAAENEVIVIDLEQGDAWWETRLLVLLAGAVRLHRPRAVVFVATEAGIQSQFQGWSRPDHLITLLLRTDPRYELSYRSVRAAALQWQLADPTMPAAAPWMSGLAPKQRMDDPTAIEMTTGARSISVMRLKELFISVLRTKAIDERSSAESQLQELSDDDSEYIPVTSSGVFLRLVRRLTVMTAMLKSVVAGEYREPNPQPTRS
jgi:hypothetical protein